MKNLVLPLAVVALSAGCASSRVETDMERTQNQSNNQNHPSIDSLFEMDANNDGKLEKSEVSGPLLNDFNKIDSDGDGFLTRLELENAPKPQKRPENRPPRH